MEDYSKLVSAAQEGDQDAYGELVEHYYGAFYALAFSAVRDESGAQEIAQEALLAGWAHIGSLREPAAFLVWMRKITRNYAVNWLRDRKFRQLLKTRLGKEPERLPGPPPTPPEELSKKERLDLLREALAALAPKWREALIVYYFERRSLKNAASFLGIRTETLKKRLRVARKALRQKWSQATEDELELLRPADTAAARQQVMGALAAGPAAPFFAKTAADSGLGMWIHHFLHGGALRLADIRLMLVTCARPVAIGAAAVLGIAAGTSAVYLAMANRSSPMHERPPVQAAVEEYYEGVGIVSELGWDTPEGGNHIMVYQVFAGHPADLAGIRAGDRVTKINGKEVTPEHMASKENRLPGPAGTYVDVTVARKEPDGKEITFETVITRALVPQRLRDEALKELGFENEK